MKFKILLFSLVLLSVIIGILIGIFISDLKEVETIRESSAPLDDLKFEEGSLKMFIPAVDSNGNGVSAALKTNIRDGSGLVLVSIDEIIAGYSTQYSSRMAVRAAKNYLNLNDTKIDVIYDIKVKSDFIDGPSAGAAMAVSLVSLLENKTINEKVSITGFIDENGIIGPASGIPEKASAMKEQGLEILLVSDQVALPYEFVRTEQCEEINGKKYCEVNYITDEELIISDMRIIPIKNLKEAMVYFYND